MPRQARQRSVTDIYHVIQRGINRIAIFGEDDDRQMFLNLLRLQVGQSFVVYGYCLMDNHFHLILKSDRLSFHIHHIASIYASWFNHKYNRCGYLFQDRFKSEAVENEDYFLCCLRYILKNPVKAGICKKIGEYRWNSYRFYFSQNETWISKDFLDSYFDSKEDLDAFLGEEDTNDYMEADLKERLTDSEVLELLQEKLGGKNLYELPAQQQRQLIKEIKIIPGVRSKQLARITGIGLNIIRRLK